jgi:hypothetical protein
MIVMEDRVTYHSEGSRSRRRSRRGSQCPGKEIKDDITCTVVRLSLCVGERGDLVPGTDELLFKRPNGLSLKIQSHSI